MVDYVPPEDHAPQGPRSRSLASDIIQAAIADASRIRLEAVRAADQMYEEIVKSAEARADSILAEAREEARRIKQEAEIRAARRGQAEGDGAESALEALRTELVAMVRQLRLGLDGSLTVLDMEHPSGQVVLEPPAPGEAAGSRRTPSNSYGKYGPQTRLRPPHSNGTSGKQDGHDRSQIEDADGSWRPPDWMSS